MIEEKGNHLLVYAIIALILVGVLTTTLLIVNSMFNNNRQHGGHLFIYYLAIALANLILLFATIESSINFF